TRRIQNPLPSGVAVQVRLPVPYLNNKASTQVGALLYLENRKAYLCINCRNAFSISQIFMFHPEISLFPFVVQLLSKLITLNHDVTYHSLFYCLCLKE
ncbi:hypothetical protein, partial [Vibrio splendidus]|uniref:hypothetical protein n=1 Tax=Vibrio splendidus TaxID=29497 RepID=UPI001A7E0E64